MPLHIQVEKMQFVQKYIHTVSWTFPIQHIHMHLKNTKRNKNQQLTGVLEHSLHTPFHLVVGVGVTSASEQPEML